MWWSCVLILGHAHNKPAIKVIPPILALNKPFWMLLTPTKSKRGGENRLVKQHVTEKLILSFHIRRLHRLPQPSIWQIQLAWHEHYGPVYTPQPRSWQGTGRMGTRDVSQTDTEAWHGGSSTWPVRWLQLKDPMAWQVGSVNRSSTLWIISASHLSSNFSALYFHMPLHSAASSATLTLSFHPHLIFPFLLHIESMLYSFLELEERF